SGPLYNSNQGRVYVFHSKGATGIATQSALAANSILTGSSMSDYFGSSFDVGDVNGDGYADVVVSAYGYNNGTKQGRAYVFHSQGTSGIATTDAGSANTILTGAAPDDYFGSDVKIGDVNGDGNGDVAVLAFANASASGSGRIYLFHSQGGSGIATQ